MKLLLTAQSRMILKFLLNNLVDTYLGHFLQKFQSNIAETHKGTVR